MGVPISSHTGDHMGLSDTVDPQSQGPIPSHAGAVVSPHGTWLPLTAGPGIRSIEVLDLSHRFAYAAKDTSEPTKARPKNALKKGLRPTKMSELPFASHASSLPTVSEPLNVKPGTNSISFELHGSQASATTNAMAATRQIYRNTSADDEGWSFSDPSPEKSTTRCGAGKTSNLAPTGKAASTSIKPMPHKRQIHEISSDEEEDDRTLYEASPRPAKAPRLIRSNNGMAGQHQTAAQLGASANPAGSSSTLISKDDGPSQPPTAIEGANTSSHISIASAPRAAPMTKSTSNSLKSVFETVLYLQTVLRIYMPNPAVLNSPPAQTDRTYVPIKLQSVAHSSDELFRQVAVIYGCGVQDISILKMRLDWEEGADGAKGVMAVKMDVKDSLVCFVEAVEAVVGKGGKEGGVEVEVVMA
ncbi:MAG: hypothetical protein L6R40_007012 [Gallowayella cf. fulva]|nr:MAG: hypothetical protein L6R40_007012 [Xanthomendoza cf. fulva]